MTQTQDTELLDSIETFLGRYYEEEIAQLAQQYPRDSTSLVIDWMDINQFDIHLGDDVRENPAQMQDYFEEALGNIDIPLDIDLSGATVRFTGLNDVATYDVDGLRVDQRNQLLQVDGQVAKRTAVEPRIVTATFECQRCGTTTSVPQDQQQLQEPHECTACERQGPFRIDYDESEFVDRQLVRIQQPPEKTKGGKGDTIDVVLEGDRVESADGGDRVHVAGIYQFQQKQQQNTPVTFDTRIEGHDVTVQESDYEDIDISKYESEIEDLANSENPIERMADSLAPEIHGYEHIKRAVTLQLFGGTKTHSPSGGTNRGDFHVMLIGDPGCGKSTILDAAADIAPRSQKASGKGATKSGLTAAAVRDDFGDSEWSLEAGALVMADKGIACVDELDKVSEETTAALHTALESQELNVNKAGINATLPTRTSLLAAGNPKWGRFDKFEPIGEQIDINAPLLSRFDLIFTVFDEPDSEKDREIADHNIQFRQEANRYTHEDGATDFENIEADVPADLFRAYIAYAKQEYHPRITDEAREQITSEYAALRSEAEDEDGDSPIPVTARWVEAFCRLAEASARARLSPVVEKEDIENARALLMKSMTDVGMDPDTGEFDADIVETGQPKSQRDRVKTILDIINNLETEFDKGAPVHLVLERAEEQEIAENTAEHAIENLKNKGEVYEPTADTLRTT